MTTELMTFAQRADGRVIYRLNNKIEERGLTRLTPDQVEWLVVTGQHADLQRAVRRQLRRLRLMHDMARYERDPRPGQLFSYLRREARATLASISMMVPSED